MRAVLTIILLSILVAPADADMCGDLIARVEAGTDAKLVKRTVDFADLSAAGGMTMTLACGELSAVGVQFRGEALPETYFPLFGRAARVVTGADPVLIADAGRRARENAVRTRHSHVDAGGALVTCSVITAAAGLVTACAAIERDERP